MSRNFEFGSSLNKTQESDIIDLHKAMICTFGLPEVSGTGIPEVFGYYHFRDDCRFWRYSPDCDKWEVVSGGPRYEYDLHSDPNVSEDELADIEDHLRYLSMMEAPQLPVDGDAMLELDPFLYNGWLFQWCFVPKLKRWEIAPLCRR